MVRTVLGDVAADRLGRTNYHEHLFQVSPLLIGTSWTTSRPARPKPPRSSWPAG